jgi:hypothetical protein
MEDRELDLMVADLGTENRMMRERNERLQRELDAALDENARFKVALERIIAVSQLAVWDGQPKGVGQVGPKTHDDKASY